ncbi:hypothetical protein [Stetteria hydrogenophila]
MIFKLPLAPAETLGRRFQYALLSLGDPGRVTVDEASGYAVFQSPDDYVEIVNNALGLISSLTVARRVKGECTDTVRGINCCLLHSGPTLYRIGSGDARLLASAGFTACPYTTSAGKKTVAWNHAAVSYADAVLSRGAPLGGQARDLPWLAKATIFGKVRTTGGGSDWKKRRAEATLDTLGSILLGGAVSFLWRGRIGDSTLEAYLTPDSVNTEFGRLRDVMLFKGLQDSTVARAARLVNTYPVSFEVAVSIALAEDLVDNLGSAEQLAYGEAASLERAASLVMVEAQMRPMVRSSTPLSTVVYYTFGRNGRTVKSVMRLASTATRYANKVNGLRDAVGGCLAAIYLQAASLGAADHLSHCLRNLRSAADQARANDLTDLAESIEWAIRLLASDYTAIAAGRWLQSL